MIFVDTPTLEQSVEFVKNNVEKGYTQFVALDPSDTVVGWCDILPHEQEGVSHVGTLGIGVLPEHRGQGLGPKLLKGAIDHAFENGLERIELDAFSTNTRAIALYEKFGFQHEGIKRKARFIDNEWSDRVMMGLLKDEWHRVLKKTLDPFV